MEFNKEKKLESIQVLRGISVILITYIHAVQHYPKRDNYNFFVITENFTNFCASGVDLFFVISGFIMMYITKSKKISFKTFLLKRFNRIVPYYWIWTIVFAVLMWFFSNNYIKDPLNIIASILFIPMMALDGSRQPVLSVGWTLNHETLFYFCFGLIYLYNKNKKINSALLSTILVLLIVNGVYRILILELIMGVIVFNLWRKNIISLINHKVRYVLFVIMILVGLTINYLTADICYGNDNLRCAFWGLGCSIILFSLVSLESNFEKFKQLTSYIGLSFLKYIGDASYSIYLTHWFFCLLSLRVSYYLKINSILYVLSLVIIMIFFGVLAYKYIERPLIESNIFKLKN